MKLKLLILLLSVSMAATAQKNITLLLIDEISREPLANATVKVTGSNKEAASNSKGQITLSVSGSTTVEVSSVGYITQVFKVNENTKLLALKMATNTLQDVVVSANRTAQKRSEAPVAIASISKQTIEDTKAQRIDFLLNKVSSTR
jgi:outer membrane receptor protein involved in Fe transport